MLVGALLAAAVSVSQAATRTTLTTSGSPSVVGEPVTLTATVLAVAPGGKVPAGSVAFRSGGVEVGTATVAPDGTASLSTTTLPLGTHSLTASFDGSPRHGGSTSEPVGHEVVAAGSSIELVADPADAVVGQSKTVVQSLDRHLSVVQVMSIQPAQFVPGE